MDDDRWQEISRLYHAAREQTDEERHVFLKSVCGDDNNLRDEVESLLADKSRAEAFLEAPTLQAAQALASLNTTIFESQLKPGTTLGNYRIERLLGRGGMGAVFLAYDTKLHRQVALKLIVGPDDNDAARPRLLYEARNAAALNHPNICTIHEVGEAGGETYIAMEFVEGRCLSDCLQEQGLPVDAVLRYGDHIAAALAHAHERNIVHRDLKCANVVITSDDRAKVLDFGLAKRLAGEELSEAATQLHAPLTQSGTMMGTLAYMAPEQLRGKPADARSDIWALGIVLYEMATGFRPFRGRTGFELSSAIMNESPAPLSLKVPSGLRAVIDRCLQKDAERRYQHAGDLREALKALQTGTTSHWAKWNSRVGRQALLAAVALVLLTIVSLGLYLGGRRTLFADGPSAPKVGSLVVLPVENLTGDAGQEYFADGMTEELITEFSRISAFKRVIPRSSVMRYKGVNRSLREIARELNVDVVVEASLLQTQDQVRTTVRLVDGSTEEHLWADRYVRRLSDVPVLYSQIADAVVKQLGLTLTVDEQARQSTLRPVNPEAYEAYLKGRFYISKLSAEATQTATEYFRLALQKEPDYALAHAGIGIAELSRVHMGFAPPSEGTPRAREAILKALALDDSVADVHEFTAGLRMYLEWDWAAAERNFLRAKELNPHNWGCTFAIYADYLLLIGNRVQAIDDMFRCLESNPLNFWVEAAFGGRLLRAGRHDDAIEWLQKAHKAEPNLALAHQYLWYAHHHQQRFDEALEKAMTFFRLKGYAEVVDAMTHGYSEAGYTGAMGRGADYLATISKDKYVQATLVAGLYAFAGDKPNALDWLDKAYEQRDSWLTFVKDDLRYTNLHAEPRFKTLLQRLNIPE